MFFGVNISYVVEELNNRIELRRFAKMCQTRKKQGDTGRFYRHILGSELVKEEDK
jgi:hypothetical protein